MMGTYVRYGERIGCAYDVKRHSSLKKAGLLNREYCLKCGFRCWRYWGPRIRWIHTSHRL